FADRSPMSIEQGSLIVLPKGLPHGIAAAADSRMVVIYALNADYTSERPVARPEEAGHALHGERKRWLASTTPRGNARQSGGDGRTDGGHVPAAEKPRPH